MKKLLCSLLSIIILLTISCEIGLGASVDTEPPALTIKNPPVGSIIRDDFAITGTYSDDGNLAGISAVLSRTDGTGPTYTFEGELSENPKDRGAGTYTIIVPAKSTDMIDGEFQAIVTVKDSLGRKTVSSATYKIDNTPPIIVLQRPGTNLDATLDNADTYGQIFSITGQGADDNNIDHIDIYFYSEKPDPNTDPKENAIQLGEDSAGNPVYSVTLKNVPPSISLDVAKYGDDVFKAIYGDVRPDDFERKQYWCRIKSYDSAKRYPMPGEEADDDDDGNCTFDYYIYSKIYNDVLKNISITDLYKNISSRSATSSSILEGKNE